MIHVDLKKFAGDFMYAVLLSALTLATFNFLDGFLNKPRCCISPIDYFAHNFGKRLSPKYFNRSSSSDTWL